MTSEDDLKAVPPVEKILSMGGVFSDESLITATGKVFALEAFLSSTSKATRFEDFIRDILSTIMNVVKSEAGSFLEVDQTNSSLFFRSVVGTNSGQVVNFVIPIGHGIVGHVAESMQPLVVADASKNEVHLKSIANSIGFETKNLVALPIIIRGKVFGVIELLNRVGDSTYSEADVELLVYLCEMAAKFIEIRLMIAWSKRQSHTPSRGEAA